MRVRGGRGCYEGNLIWVYLIQIWRLTFYLWCQSPSNKQNKKKNGHLVFKGQIKVFFFQRHLKKYIIKTLQKLIIVLSCK